VFHRISSIAALAALALPCVAQDQSHPVQLKVIVSDLKINGTPWDGPDPVALAALSVLGHSKGFGNLLFAKLESKPDPVVAFIDDSGIDVRFAPNKDPITGARRSLCQDQNSCAWQFVPNHNMAVLVFDCDIQDHDWIEGFILFPSLQQRSQQDVERLTRALFQAARKLNVISGVPDASKIPVLTVSDLSGDSTVELPQATLAIRPVLSPFESALQRQQSDKATSKTKETMK